MSQFREPLDLPDFSPNDTPEPYDPRTESELHDSGGLELFALIFGISGCITFIAGLLFCWPPAAP
jgi:hypothetical protein